jgi:heterodisulfide reductase subunit A
LSSEPRIGFYICHCGSNIAGIVDVSDVADFARRLNAVIVSRDYRFMCSNTGQELIKKDIKELGLNRIVVAACSPTMHEPTFRRICQEAGINQYLFQMANIREQCSWVTRDSGSATEKARALVGAAVSRVYYQKLLMTRRVDVNPNTLIVGGGIAGIETALKIADSEHKVYLVEREPCIGGHMAQFDKTFPTLDCSACILTPKMTSAGQHPNIQLLTYSDVVEFSGYVGNFKAKIRKNPRYVDEKRCTGCGSCWQKCPVKVNSEFDEGLGERKAIYVPFPQAVPNVPVIDKANCLYFKRSVCRICERACEAGAIDFEQKDASIEADVGTVILATGYDYLNPGALPQYGYGRYDNVITGLQFERLSNAAGPTGGKLLLKNGREPESVAIVHCVGSRDQNYQEYCSQVCCMYALKYSHLIREKTSATVYQMYIDMRCAGKGYEEFYKRVSDEKVNFIRGKVSEVTAQAPGKEESGKLVVSVADTLVGSILQIPVDMVVLCSAMKARSDADKTARLFSLSRSADGFLLEKHPKLDPIATTTDGIFVAGCCQGPKDIPSTVAQAQAAAAAVLSLLSRGSVEIEAVTAFINEKNCSGCQVCKLICPYGAISFVDEKQVCRVNDALCKGCGACVSGCPSGSSSLNNFTSEQIISEMEGMLI